MQIKHLAALLFVVCSGCKQSYPEEPYRGQEHWVSVGPGWGSSTSEYDMGSVRRVGDTVIVNWKLNEDVFGWFGPLSHHNLARQQGGAPLLVRSNAVAQMNCVRRTIRFSNIELHSMDNSTAFAPDGKEMIIPPNSPMEEAFTSLCE